jgi:hypothetical protein
MALEPPPFHPTMINTTPKNMAATPSVNAIMRSYLPLEYQLQAAAQVQATMMLEEY